jgi:hypothetical protein
MESAPDLLHIFAQALAIFAESLDRWLHVPWPLPFAVLLIPVVAVLDVVVWSLRGKVFPLRCGYYPTVERTRCRRWVSGEWRKCHDHRKAETRKTDKHPINPKQRRWEVHEQFQGRALDVQGRGFLSMRSPRNTLLYREGFARWPEDVRKGEVLADYWRDLISRWSELRSLGLRGLFGSTDQRERLILTSPVLLVVIPATQLALGMVVFGLVLVGVSTMAPSPTNMIFEYCAAFSFMVAFAVTRAGITRPDPDPGWLRQSLTDVGRWIAGLTGIAVLTGLIGLYGHEAVDIVKTVVQTIFTAFIFVFVVYLLYRYGTKKKAKATKKKRASRKGHRKRK